MTSWSRGVDAFLVNEALSAPAAYQHGVREAVLWRVIVIGETAPEPCLGAFAAHIRSRFREIQRFVIRRPTRAMSDLSTLALQGLQIVWINILLSGDNAVVIALVCRGLHGSQRKWAILIGSIAAVLLRIAFTFFIVELLALPFVKLASGLLLFWIAFDLMRGDSAKKDIAAASSIWGAVRTIALADAIMSLDNVVAVAAAAKNNVPLIVFGIAISVPLIIFGSTLVLKLLTRFPILVVAGSVLLGWVAGGIIASDPEMERWFGTLPHHADLIAAGGGAILMLLGSGVLRLSRAKQRKSGPADARAGQAGYPASD